jgi:hypothetical protein
VPDAPVSADLSLLAALASDLASVHYTVDGVAELLGVSASEALGRDQTVPALLVVDDVPAARATEGLAVVVFVWLLGQPVSEVRLSAAFPRTGVNGLRQLGLAAPVAAGPEFAGTELTAPAGAAPQKPADVMWTALVDLRPYGWEATADGGGGADLWVASDLSAHQRDGVLRKDHVLGIGHASLTLAQLTVRRPVARALDLGTGCGIQTFHLLQHAQHVTATDISARALAFTRFNVLLNSGMLGVDPEHPEGRISLRLGSLLEPVAGESFDLVVSNPPFVITPRNRGETAAEQFTYRDGGLPGDDIVATLVRRLPSALIAGGTAQLLGNWEIPADCPWDERPRSWVPDSADAWFIQRDVASPARYAETWLKDAAEGRDRGHYVRAYGAYLKDFAARNVEGIGFGYIWLRRPDRSAAPRLRRFEELTHPLQSPLGPVLGAAVERFDWLSGADLDAAHLLVAEDVTEERHQRPGAEHPGVILVRQGAGLRRTNLLSTELAGFVSACDGDLAVGQLVAALAGLLERSDPAFGVQLRHDVRNLVLEGFLIPG